MSTHKKHSLCYDRNLSALYTVHSSYEDDRIDDNDPVATTAQHLLLKVPINSDLSQEGSLKNMEGVNDAIVYHLYLLPPSRLPWNILKPPSSSFLDYNNGFDWKIRGLRLFTFSLVSSAVPHIACSKVNYFICHNSRSPFYIQLIVKLS